MHVSTLPPYLEHAPQLVRQLCPSAQLISWRLRRSAAAPFDVRGLRASILSQSAPANRCAHSHHRPWDGNSDARRWTCVTFVHLVDSSSPGVAGAQAHRVAVIPQTALRRPAVARASS